MESKVEYAVDAIKPTYEYVPHTTQSTSLLIVDVDRTICDFSSNIKPISNASWERLFSSAVPRQETLRIIKAIQPAFHHTVICTGRKEMNREITEQWIKSLDDEYRITYNALLMRANGDNRAADVIKLGLWQSIVVAYHASYVLVIDDDVLALRHAQKLGYAIINPSVVKEE